MKCIILKRILKRLTNNCKSPQNFYFLETELGFRLAWFEKISWVIFYSLWEIKNMGAFSLKYLYKKPYRIWPTPIKTFRKHQNAPTRTHKKVQILLGRFLDEYAQFPTPIPHLPQLIFWRRTIFLKTFLGGSQKGEEIKYTGRRRDGSFSFSCSHR